MKTNFELVTAYKHQTLLKALDELSVDKVVYFFRALATE